MRSLQLLLLLASLLSPVIATAAPTVTTVAGGGSDNPTDGVPALSVRLDYPDSVAADGSGNVYFTDRSEVFKVDPLGTLSRVLGLDPCAYFPTPGAFTRDLCGVGLGLDTDAAGNLFINHVRPGVSIKSSPAGVILTVFPYTTYDGMMAVSPDGTVWFASRFRLSRFAANGDLMRHYDNSDFPEFEYPDYPGMNYYTNPFGWITDIAVDRLGRVYYVDDYLDWVMKFDPQFPSNPVPVLDLDTDDVYVSDYYGRDITIDKASEDIYVSGTGSLWRYRDGRMTQLYDESDDLCEWPYNDVPESRPLNRACFDSISDIKFEGGSVFVSEDVGLRFVGRVSFGGSASRPMSSTFGSTGVGPGGHSSRTTRLVADPVNSATGSFFEQQIDASMRGIGVPFTFRRTYNSADTTAGPFGIGWAATFHESLEVAPDGSVTFRSDDGEQIVFSPEAAGGYSSEPGVLSTLSVIAAGYELRRRDQVIYRFDASGNLTQLRDRNNRGLSFSYDLSDRIATATDAGGRVVIFGYDAANHLDTLALPDGRTVKYGYSGDSLTSVTDLAGNLTQYFYDASGRLSEVIDQNGHSRIRNVYGADGRVAEQFDALGERTQFDWDESTQTSTMTDARGGVWQDVYLDNVLQEQIDPLGNSTQFEYDAEFNVEAVTDPRGNVTAMSYDDRGNLLTRTAPPPLSYVETYTYDTDSNILAATDGRGATTSYGYDALGNRVLTTLPDGATITYTRDARGLPATIIDPRGNVTTHTYDSVGNLTRVTSPLGHAGTMAYDAVGRLTSRVDARGNEPGADPGDYRTTFAYDAMDRATTVTDSLGHTTTSTYDPVGNLLTTTGPTGAVTTSVYDEADQRVTTTGADGGTSTFGYDDSGHLIATTNPLGDTATYAYDAAGRLASMVTARGNAPSGDPSTYRTTHTYDPNGNLMALTNALGETTTSTYDVLNRRISTTDPLGRTTTYVFDEAGNTTSMTDATGATTSLTYDLRGRITSSTDATGHTTSHVYDGAGNRTATASPLGAVTAYTFDGDNRMVAVVDPRGNAPGGTPTLFQTTFTYDEAGQLTAATDPLGNQTTYTYDRAGNRLRMTDANGHTTDYTHDAADRLASVQGPDGALTSYDYDAVGQIVNQTDPNGHVTSRMYDLARRGTETVSPLSRRRTFGYDPEGNLLSFVDPRGHAAAAPNTGTVRYAYDAAGRLVSVDYGDGTPDVAYVRSAAGEIASMADGQGVSGVENYTYDPVGRPLSVMRDSAALTYTYDAAGRVLTRTYPTGNAKKPFVESMAYDPAGRLTQIRMNGVPLATYTYDEASQLVSRTLANGVTEKRTYDPAGRLLGVRHTSAAGVLASFTYDYDAVGNPVAIRGLVETETYTYDPANRLTQVCYTAACTEPESFIRYTYDGVGNRLTEERSMGVTTYSYDADDQLVQTTAPAAVLTTYTYDSSGNQLSAGETTFEYDLANRMIEAGTGKKRWAYTYDGSGKRLTMGKLGAKQPKTRFLWDPFGSMPRLALELTPKGLEKRRYIESPDPLATGKGTKLSLYYLLDGLGSVRAATNSKGKLAGGASYEPFGADRGKLSASLKKSALRFAGQYQDAETGLYHLRARKYDPATGRFTSIDPLSRPQVQPGASSYVYADNRPTVFVDPQGLRPVPVRQRPASMCYPAEHPVTIAPPSTTQAVNGIQNWGCAANPSVGITMSDYGGSFVDTLANPTEIWRTLVSEYHWVNENLNPAYRFLVEQDQCRNGSWEGGSRAEHCIQAAIALAETAAVASGGVVRPRVAIGGAAERQVGASVVRYDVDFALTGLTRGGSAKASELVEFGQMQGWSRVQSATGPMNFVDENGITRLAIKSGSPNAPGSNFPHVEMRNALGQRIDSFGNPVTRRNPLNHTPIEWDLP